MKLYSVSMKVTEDVFQGIKKVQDDYSKTNFGIKLTQGQAVGMMYQSYLREKELEENAKEKK